MCSSSVIVWVKTHTRFFSHHFHLFQATQFVQDAVCTCDFGVSLKSGIGLNAECIFPEPIDIENDANLPLRGTPSFSGDYSARGIRESMVGFAFEDIIGYTIDAPFPLSDVVVDINMGTMLIDLTHGKRFKIEECQATYNNEACKSCTPCENGYSIKFDCSNVSLYNSPFGAIFFPFFTDCVGAGAPQSVNGPANSVQAFVPGIPM